MAEVVQVTGKRAVGRPRQFDDGAERQLILDAAYAALRDHGPDFTIVHILTNAGVSTRSFYRHFDSKDSLIHAMYLRDGEWAAERLTKRLTRARETLVESLHGAIEAGVTDGSFTAHDTATVADLIAVVALHAAGLPVPNRELDQSQTVEFCLRALGCSD